MIIIVLIIGLLIGSFLNVCVYRIPREESIVFPSSHCPGCNTSLKPRDLIPVLSFVAYKGRCRYCSEKISSRYPIVELLNSALFVLLYIQFGISLQFVAYAALTSVLLAMSIIDYDHLIIPDGIQILIILIGLGYKVTNTYISNTPFPYLDSLLGLLIGGGFLLLVAIVSNGGMGGGDIKLMGVLGFWLGWRTTLLMMLLSFIIGGVLSIILLATKKKGRKESIPFGPFIAIATFITICWQSEILTWYIRSFFQ